MPESCGNELPAATMLAVKLGPIWSGTAVEATLRLEGERLTVAVAAQELDGGRRRAITRLFGEEALAGLDAGRSATLEFAAAEPRFSFSDAPGRRASIVVEVDGRPKFSLNFLDWTAVGDVAHRGHVGQILMRTMKVLSKRRGAREAREAWRGALEALAGQAEGADSLTTAD